MPTQVHRDIVMAAYTYLQGAVLPTQKVTEARTEEVKFNEDSKEWLVVLSYDNIGDNPFDRTRAYKKFIVEDTADKRVKSMESLSD